MRDLSKQKVAKLPYDYWFVKVDTTYPYTIELYIIFRERDFILEKQIPRINL